MWRRVVVCVALATLTACGPAATQGPAGSDESGTAAPALDQVSPLSDVRDWDGAVTVSPSTSTINPVATDPTPDLPVTVTDHQGTKVTITDASRILALDVYGTLSRTVYDLGLGDRLVGRDISTQFAPADKLPLVTQNGHNLNAEAILALNPSVIITDTSLGPYDVLAQMRDAGIPVVIVDSARGLDNVTELITATADALGVPAQGTELARRTEAEITAVRNQIAAIAPTDDADKLRTVFLYVRGQSGVYYMFGEGSGADQLIDAVGGYDVADEIGWSGMKPVTEEGLIAAQPELVLMMTGGLESVGGADGLLDRIPALANTPAGEHRRIVAMDDSTILGFGPVTAAVLEALAVGIYAPQALGSGS